MADAVLYEGYILYPYRKSSAKNRVRWQFGVLAPRPWIEAQGVADDTCVAGSVESWFQQTECLIEPAQGTRLDAIGLDVTVHLRLRFLQLQTKSVEQRAAAGVFAPVDAAHVDGQVHLSFEEAVPQEHDIHVSLAEIVEGAQQFTVTCDGGVDVETLPSDAGRVVRRRWPISATVTVSADVAEAPFPLLRLRARTDNTVETLPGDASRDEALRQTLLAAHTVLAVDGGGFVSLLDPPQWASAAAKACTNVHTFPVLAGEAGSRDLVLSSPIILYDHVQVAPESPGDLHDGGEIDEILSLRTLTLTDAEKAEARATDPRTSAIVDRVDVMPPEIMDKLHGAIRSLRPAAAPANVSAASAGAADPVDVGWWEPGADDALSPENDVIVIDGVEVRRGSRVRLHPRRRGTDAHDMFLAGRTAVVDKVLLDVEDARHLAVTLDDDPAAELHQWYGRFRYFFPEEIEPLPAEDRP